jgi:hypothetical protein
LLSVVLPVLCCLLVLCMMLAGVYLAGCLKGQPLGCPSKLFVCSAPVGVLVVVFWLVLDQSYTTHTCKYHSFIHSSTKKWGEQI